MDRAPVISQYTFWISKYFWVSDSESTETRVGFIYTRLLFNAKLQNLLWKKLLYKINRGESLSDREPSSPNVGSDLTLSDNALSLGSLAAWELMEIVLLLWGFRGDCLLLGLRASLFVLRLFKARTRTIVALLSFGAKTHLVRLSRQTAFINL